MKAWWRQVRPYILALPVYTLVRLIGLTLRIQVEGYDRYRGADGGRIFAGWHGKTLLAALFFRGQGLWTIVSRSRDGEMQNRIFRRFGFETIRGSSGRGGVQAAREAIQVLRQGKAMAFTPDGPRGPSGVVQAGIVLMAQKSGAELVPVGVSCSRRWLAPTWDRYMVPKPFARGLMIFGEPITVKPDCTREEFEAARSELERRIHELEAEAERRMGRA